MTNEQNVSSMAMANERQSSKGGSHVGSILHLFDWNAKSRKKLFSNRSSTPEKSKQNQSSEGGLPVTWIQTMDGNDSLAGSCIKGSSGYSCASSVTDEDEDLYGTKTPGVVARLMGLDFLPSPNYLDASTTPLSVPGSYNKSKDHEYHQDHKMSLRSGWRQVAAPGDGLEPKKVINRPVPKFQTETLPPKSAKAIQITQQMLMSPMKRKSYTPSKDAAQIMEAAARIIEPENHARTGRKLRLDGVPSVPLKVRHMKEEAQRTESSSKHENSGSRKKHKDATSIRIYEDSEESSASATSTRKTVSLALQAKANVLKRERENSDSGRGRTLVSQKETMEVNLNPEQLLSSQSAIKSLTQNGLSALHQNNQKENCNGSRGKLPPKSTLQGGKTLSENSSSAEKQGSRKMMTSEVKDHKKKVSSSSKKVTSKKQPNDPSYHSDGIQGTHSKRKDENSKGASQSDTLVNVHWNEDGGMDEADVISFTFNAPIPRSEPGCLRTNGVPENSNIIPADSTGNRTLLNSDGSLGHKVEGGDTLGKYLDRILEELNHKTDPSQQKTGLVLQHTQPGLDAVGMLQERKIYQMEARTMDGRNIYSDRKPLECLRPSPVNVLDYSSITSSCYSADNADNNSTEDSASSIAARIPSRKQEIPCSSQHLRYPKNWELEYLKEILVNIQPMFETYALRSTCEVISPHLFYQIESHISCSNSCVLVPKTIRRLWFDCANEYLGLIFKHYAREGWRSWAKGLRIVHRKDELAEEIYEAICGSNATGDLMIDELVNNDMSSKHGRWLNYEAEAYELGIQIQSRILNSLVDEVVADISWLSSMYWELG